MKRKTPESYVLKAVQDYLGAKRIMYFRMNTLAMPTSDGKRFIKAGTPGMADVLAFPQIKITAGTARAITPLPLWIEVKAEKGKQSILQALFQKQVEDEGHMYIIARSVEDLDAALKGA
jgi:hypothetical protein